MRYDFSISCALGSSGSYIGSGYALLCTMTVNGSSGQVRIKANDDDYWSGTSPRVRTVSVTCGPTSANAAQGVRFQVVFDGRLALSSGPIDNSSYTVTSSPMLITASGAPSACAVSSNLAEGNVNLSWSGAASGNNNTISSYEIQYSDSSNNSSWGSWTALTTVSTTATSGSISVSPPTIRGYYRRFQVRTCGSAGSGYYSGWKMSSNSVRKNTAPLMPTSVVATPAIYGSEEITLTWSGASVGTSAIKGYQIASQISTDNATWSAWKVLDIITLAASGGTYHPAVSNVAGTYTRFGIWTIDAFDIYSSEKISDSILCSITACGAPTSCSLSTTVSEGNTNLAWAGASGGGGNAITGYEIQYSESVDGAIWGEWVSLSTVPSTTTSGSTPVAPSSICSNYRRFQIRTQGAAGESYFSLWKGSSNTVLKNVLPIPPASFTAAPRVYEAVDTVPSNSLSSTWTVTPSKTAGLYTRYRISVTDLLNAVSSWVTSNTVKKNTRPLAPLVEAPKSGCTTYNQNPHCLIQTQPEPDGNEQTIYVLTADGTWLNSADDPEYFSANGSSASSVKTVFTSPSVAPGTSCLSIQCRDAYSSSTTVTRQFFVSDSPFEPIQANETHVKASHISTLRAAINHVRNYYNLPVYVWNYEVNSSKTNVAYWPSHILELRAAIQGVADKINLYSANSGAAAIDDVQWIPLGYGQPRADVMNQLYDLLLML